MRELVHIKLYQVNKSKLLQSENSYLYLDLQLDLLTNICLKICLRTLALLSEIIFILGTSPIVCDVGSSVRAFPAAVLDQQEVLYKWKSPNVL